MTVQLPDAGKIEELLASYCPDGQRRAFVHWFARRVAGKEYANPAVVEVELVATLDDYAGEHHLSQTAVNLMYIIHGKEWLSALAG